MRNEETYFLSLRGAKGQLGYECDTIKNQAYKQTYEAVKSDPKQLEKIDKGLITDLELEESFTHFNPRGCFNASGMRALY